MCYRNFICYRGGTAGEVFAQQLHKHLAEFSNIFGNTYFSHARETKGSFLLDIPELMAGCEHVIVMLTPNFFDGFLENDEISKNSITRTEIQSALDNPSLKFIPIIFRGFVWNDENRALFRHIFVGEHDRFLTALPIHYDPSMPDEIISKIGERIRTNEFSAQALSPVTLPHHREKTLVLDGLQENLIEATKKHLESNYHLQITRAHMDVFIEGTSFRTCYIWGGTVLRKRKDRVRGMFFNVVTPANDPADSLVSYGYDLLQDPERKQPLPFQPLMLSGMARKMYLPLPNCAKKGDSFLVEIHSKTKNAITPLLGISKFLFRLPFHHKFAKKQTPEEYRLSLHFNTNPKWVKSYRIEKNGTATFLEYLVPRSGSLNGFYSFDERIGSEPVGTIRAYTFER